MRLNSTENDDLLTPSENATVNQCLPNHAMHLHVIQWPCSD